ncbi:MAG: formylglycine-generating enzyme family protein, partial [Thermosynechococcaceae cyanobacterium]
VSVDQLSHFTLASQKPTLPTFPFEVMTVDAKGKKKQSQSGSAQFFAEDLGNGVTLKMVSIPSGPFMMGSPDTEARRRDCEGPQHQVTVSEFFMGKYPVTQAQWKAVAALPKVKQDLNPDPAHFKGADHPVETVSWYDAIEFCERLSLQTERQYRLPSEAEWEYACRAGTTTPFNFGDTINTDVANYRGQDREYQGTTYPGAYGDGPYGKFRQKTTPVDYFNYFNAANRFGLCDLHGNVWEWCQDTPHDSYEGAPTDGSAWIDNDNDFRILRGGSWIYVPAYCRSANRVRYGPSAQYYDIGFRVVCAVPSLL